MVATAHVVLQMTDSVKKMINYDDGDRSVLRNVGF
jgi:hypothetical protein